MANIDWKRESSKARETGVYLRMAMREQGIHVSARRTAGDEGISNEKRQVARSRKMSVSMRFPVDRLGS